jgi:hypothetical protein
LRYLVVTYSMDNEGQQIEIEKEMRRRQRIPMG